MPRGLAGVLLLAVSLAPVLAVGATDDEASSQAETPAAARARVEGASAYRSAVAGGRGYVSTVSQPTWSRSARSQMRESEPRTSATRESQDASSAGRESATRESAWRESAGTWSESPAAEMRWSEPSASAESSATDPGSAAAARAAVTRPESPAVSAATSAWLRDNTEIGDVRSSLPPIYGTVTIDDRTYYMFDDRYYQPVTEQGRVAYVVVAPPVGARISRLPWGCQRVVIARGEYWSCEGNWYRKDDPGWMVIAEPRDDGSAVPEP